MKWIIVVLVAVVLLCGTLVGCFNQESSTPGNDNATTGTSDTGSDSTADKNTGEEGTGTEDDGDIDTESSSGSTEVKTDTGRYQGQIDANSIEIKISGVPDEIAAKAFRLSEEIKGKFESLELKKDDVIKVEYNLNENDQPVIVNIEKLVNAS